MSGALITNLTGLKMSGHDTGVNCDLELHRMTLKRRSIRAQVTLAAPMVAGVLGMVASPSGWCQQAVVATSGTSAPVEVDASDASEPTTDRIVITGSSQRGEALGSTPPDLELNDADIQALGVTDLAGLLDAIAPEASSGGDPVILLNGVRVASTREIRQYPSEAVERVQVLPEQVAAAYGYGADRKVVNFILRKHFEALTLVAETELRTEGAGEEYEMRGGMVRVQGDKRWNLNGRYQATRPILESDRDVPEVQDGYSLRGNIVPAAGAAVIDRTLDGLAGEPVRVASVPDTVPDRPLALEDFVLTANMPSVTSQHRYKSLVARRNDAELSAAYNQTLGNATQAGVSVALDYYETEGLLGLRKVAIDLPPDIAYSPFSEPVRLLRLGSVTEPRRRVSDELSVETAFHANHVADDWIAGVSGTLEHRVRNVATDRSFDADAIAVAVRGGVSPFGDLAPYLDRTADRTRTESTEGDVNLTLNGDLFEAPAGDAASMISVGYGRIDRASQSRRDSRYEVVDLTRDYLRLRSNLDIPLVASWMELPLIEQLSVNLNLSRERLSDFGVLSAYGGGASWTPVDRLRLHASYATKEGAPSVNQLGDPAITTPDQRILDQVVGETVFATRIDGGNPSLSGSASETFKLGARFDPIPDVDFFLRADYTNTEIRNPVRSFPDPTPEIEAAFPARFMRDEAGQLTAFDNRPVNLLRSDSRDLRFAFRYAHDLEIDEAGSEPALRVVTSLNHLWRLRERLQIAADIEPLDYLGGAVGARPAHEIRLASSLTQGGAGAKMEVNWRSETQVHSAVSEPHGLNFSDLATVRLEAFYSFSGADEEGADLAWLSGARISLMVDNVFNKKQHVADSFGATPRRYNADLLDPVGRTIELQFLKQLN